ncbi:MAG: cereblon family protein [Pseudomonadales bacterium]
MAETGLDPVAHLMESLEEDSGDLLLCRCCNAAITRSSEKIEIGISHHYRFTNPAGISYSIGCFRNASGCSIVGAATDEESWFGGYKWQMAICSECQEHLGWYYQNRRERFFFGLIQDRLIIAST